MYISGSTITFESRLHQLPTVTGDLAKFLNEGLTYTAGETFHVVNKWNREYNLKYYQFTRDGDYLTHLDFFVTLINARLLEDGNARITEDGNIRGLE